MNSADVCHTEFECSGACYAPFDTTISEEFGSGLTADTIVNRSPYCATLFLDEIADDAKGGLPGITAYLPKGGEGAMGVYHLWLDYGYCSAHRLHHLKCVYVGKGKSATRIAKHIENMWRFTKEPLRVSFYPCSNRVAKYIEQLFLDTYRFAINKAEMSGSAPLYARWSEERFTLGTITQQVVDSVSRKAMERMEAQLGDD